MDVAAFDLDARLHELLTLQGPVANDLRLLLSLQKVLRSIERIGDNSLNVARLIAPHDSAAATSPDLQAQLHELARRAERAVRIALDQFSHRGTTNDAVEIVERQIDQLHTGLTTRLVDHAGTGRSAAEWAVNMVLVSRHLERIGDHAVKISRESHFVVTGERPPPRHRIR